MAKQVRIHRSAKDKDNPYKPVSRAAFDGSGLSFEARGVLAYVLMKPDDWEVNVPDLMREGGIGRDKAYRIVEELLTAGYGKRADGRDKAGKFGGNEIHIYESAQQGKATVTEGVEPCTEKPYAVTPDTDIPHTEKPDTEKPDTAEPDTAEPDTENQEHTKEGIELKSEETKKGTATQPAGQDKALTPQQAMYGAICEALGWDYHVIAEKDKVQVAQAVKILSKAEYTVDDIRRFMVDVWFRDYRWEKFGQRPTLGQLRQEIGKLRAGVPEQVPRPPPVSNGRVAASLAAIDEYDRIKSKHGVTT